MSEGKEHRAMLQELESALLHDEPMAFATWKEELYAWEADPSSNTNPFDPKVESKFILFSQRLIFLPPQPSRRLASASSLQRMMHKHRETELRSCMTT